MENKARDSKLNQPDWAQYLALRKDSPYTKEELEGRNSQLPPPLEGSEHDVVIPWEKVKDIALTIYPDSEVDHSVLTTKKDFREIFLKTDFNLSGDTGPTRKIYVVGVKKKEGEWIGRRGMKFKYCIIVIDAVTGDSPAYMFCPDLRTKEWNTMFSHGCKDFC